MILLIIVVTLSCQSQERNSGIIDQVSGQSVSLEDIRPNDIVHDTLSEDQLEKIHKIQVTFAEVNPTSLEETIINFKRDRHPDREIQIWLTMADAYERFLSKRKNLESGKKKEAYKLLLLRSMEEESGARAKAGIQLLTEAEVAELLRYYTMEAKPVTVGRR